MKGTCWPALLLACAAAAACEPAPATHSTAVPATERPTAAVSASGLPTAPLELSTCPATAPTTAERPRDANTAAFSRAWYVSDDHLLWASAQGRLYVGENKVLWERPGSRVDISGKLLSGDPRTAGAPTISGPQGYEASSYQASGVSFPVAGCWIVEARAASSVLGFVALVYPERYAPVGRRCEDLADIYAQADAVVLATSEEERPDETFRGFTWYALRASRVWKGTLSSGSELTLLTDSEAEPRITPTTRYVLFLARDASKPWRIVCSFRSVMADLADRRLMRPTDHQEGAAIITDVDFATLDERLRALAGR